MALTEGQMIALIIVCIILVLLYLNPLWVTAIGNFFSPPAANSTGSGSSTTGSGSSTTGSSTTGSGSSTTQPVVPPPPPPPPPPPTGPAYNYVGCYVDTCGGCDTSPVGPDGGPTDAGLNCPGRSLPMFYRRYNQQPTYPIDKCYQLAKAGKNKYFGQQFGTECWAGNDLTRAQQAGTATNCNSMGGDGRCVNDIYQINY